MSGGRGMKTWTHRSLNRSSQSEMPAIGVEKSFDPSNEPGIPRISILFPVFSHNSRLYLNPILFMALAFKLAPCNLLSQHGGFGLSEGLPKLAKSCKVCKLPALNPANIFSKSPVLRQAIRGRPAAAL